MKEASVRIATGCSSVLLQRIERRGAPEPGPLDVAELLAQPPMKPTQPLDFPVNMNNHILSKG